LTSIWRCCGAKRVDERNVGPPNRNTFNSLLRLVAQIQTHSRSASEHRYRDFLISILAARPTPEPKHFPSAHRRQRRVGTDEQCVGASMSTAGFGLMKFIGLKQHSHSSDQMPVQ
jgi:hypothetical protein